MLKKIHASGDDLTERKGSIECLPFLVTFVGSFLPGVPVAILYQSNSSYDYYALCTGPPLVCESDRRVASEKPSETCAQAKLLSSAPCDRCH